MSTPGWRELTRDFLEGKTRNHGDDVIDSRLEAGRGFARDVTSKCDDETADEDRRHGAGLSRPSEPLLRASFRRLTMRS